MSEPYFEKGHEFNAVRKVNILQSLGGNHLLQMLEMGTRELERNREYINSLNVFPVPDGDTGTNMALTLRAALRQAASCSSQRVDEIAEAAARGALFGARGNSGVILSQYIRGFADGLSGKAEADVEDIVAALESASKRAYAAVMEPSEGTMLTVGRRAAEAARQAIDHAGDVVHLWEITHRAACDAVEETPEMLPLLRDAGVVDAGGKAMAVVMEGALRVLKTPEVLDESITAQDYTEFDEAHAVLQITSGDIQASGSVDAIHPADIQFRYCTEFLVHCENVDADALRSRLMPLGDSLLVVGDASIIKVHLHTNHPGQALEICGELGHLADIKIDNMVLQNEAVVARQRREYRTSEDDGSHTLTSTMKPNGSSGLVLNPSAQAAAVDTLADVGVVAVVHGKGFEHIFSELGVAVTVIGGQTMNPSAQELRDAIESLPARTVVVLPNNSNVVLTARQAAELCDKEVHVLPTTSMPQGVAAMVVFDPTRPIGQLFADMTKAAEGVRTGELTRAVRSVRNGTRLIEEGQVIGVVAGEIVSAGADCGEVLEALVAHLWDQQAELITLYYGADIKMEEAQAIADRLAKQYQQADVECYAGGQPYYDYLIAVE